MNQVKINLSLNQYEQDLGTSQHLQPHSCFVHFETHKWSVVGSENESQVANLVPRLISLTSSHVNEMSLDTRLPSGLFLAPIFILLHMHWQVSSHVIHQPLINISFYYIDMSVLL